MSYVFLHINIQTFLLIKNPFASSFLYCVMQQENYKKEASAMDGCQEEELFELSLAYSLPNIGNTCCWLTSTYDDDVEEEEDDMDNSFVFQIDQSLLIDTRLVLLDKMIGEGAYSTVHKGL